MLLRIARNNIKDNTSKNMYLGYSKKIRKKTIEIVKNNMKEEIREHMLFTKKNSEGDDSEGKEKEKEKDQQNNEDFKQRRKDKIRETEQMINGFEKISRQCE